MNKPDTQPNFQDLNALAAYIYNEVNQKWWMDEHGTPIKRNHGELLMLVITELAEAVEGIRKNLMDDHLPHRKMEEVEMADAKIRLLDFAAGFKIKLGKTSAFHPTTNNKADQILGICDAVCQVREHFGFMLKKHENELESCTTMAISTIESYCCFHNLDLEGAMREKIEYNKSRLDHTHEARKQANGKKF